MLTADITLLRNRLIEEVIEREGGFIDHPDDLGGPTKYGITQTKAREFDYHGAMQDFPFVLAKDIYNVDFWLALELRSIAEIADEKLATAVFDFAINSGQHRAAVTLQRCLNAFNKKATLYPDITVDGIIYKKTLSALTAFIRHRASDTVLTDTYNALRTAYFVEIAEAREKNESFLYGWVNRVRYLFRQT